jgi:glycosyltransferase involved in cell wall biosynthesis
VLNPADGRKNWIDLITAFCWAFKHNENATLIVKMTHNDPEYYRVALMTLLSRLAPFQCRVLILHGFLEDEQYQALIQASNYYVNASSCEGLCLPLMEFLASGKPAIAPDHTAMADYVNDTFAFVLQTSLEPTCWPQDPAGMMLTHRHRLNWESLMKAFRHSYQVALEDPARAQRMSSQAYLNMRDFASVEQVHKPLKDFLEQVLSRAKRPAPSLQP